MPKLSDILDLLRRWDYWKRIEEAPERLDSIEQRVAHLEERLKRAPGEGCPRCGALAFRIQEARQAPEPWGSMGAREHVRRCEECSFEDVEMTTPKG